MERKEGRPKVGDDTNTTLAEPNKVKNKKLMVNRSVDTNPNNNFLLCKFKIDLCKLISLTAFTKCQISRYPTHTDPKQWLRKSYEKHG